MTQTFGAVMDAEGRKNNFDFLRFVLAASVVLLHCYVLLSGSDAQEPISRLTHGQASGGTAVPFFFAISGFLVTQSWQRSRSAASYLKKRLLRLYPAFIVVSLFCALVVGPLGADSVADYFRHLDPPRFFAYMLLVGPYLPPVFLHLPLPNAVDGSFWTLRYEFECYLLVMLLGWAGGVARRGWVAGLFLAVFALFLVQAYTAHPPLPDREWHLLGNLARWPGLLIYFVGGMGFFLYRDRITYSRLMFAVCLGVLALFGIFLRGLNSVLPLAGTYALFYIAYSPRLRVQNFGRFGDFSYGVYLYSFPIQQLLIRYLGRSIAPLTLFALALAMTLCLAALSWHCVEKPCLRLKRSA